jgi:TolB protein
LAPPLSEVTLASSAEARGKNEPRERRERGMAGRRTLYLPVMITVAVAVACLVAFLVLSEEKAKAAFPGKNGKIAFFDRSESGDYDIYSMKPDGTDRNRLTEDTANDYAPDLSPNGKKIAFASLRSGANKIYVMKADGTAVRNLSGSEVGEGGPAWSPDGTEIAFEKDGDVWVMDADGSNRKNLTNTPPVNGYEVRENDPAYSPDGTKIVFYKETFRPRDVDLYTITVDGKELRQVTDFPGKEFSPDWSPSGNRLAYVRSTRTSGERVTTIRPDGTRKKFIAQDGYSPVFSPDGRRIAFDRNGDLYKAKSDGSGEPGVVGGPAESSELAPDWGPMRTATAR